MSWIIATREPPTQFTVDRIMDENDFLLDIINKKLTSGDFEEAVSYQKILQRNLTFLIELRARMSKMNEGYLCPECFLNLDSETALLAHFEKKHLENLEKTTVNHVTEYYKDLIIGSTNSNNSPKSLRLKNVLDLLLDGNLTHENIPEIGLTPKLQAFLKNQSEKELLISQLSAELESAKQNKIEGEAESLIAELKVEIESYKHVIKVNSSETESVDNSDVLVEINFLRTQLNDLKAENNDLKEKSKNQESLEQLVMELEKEIGSLKDQLEEKKALVNQNEKLKSWDESSQNEIQSLKLNIENSNTIIEQFKIENADLKKKIDTLKLFDESSLKEIELSKSSLEDSNEIAGELKVEIANLAKEIDVLKSVEESTQKELESLRSSLEKSNATISELNTENVDLTRKIQDMKHTEKAFKSELESLKLSFENSNTTVDKLKMENSDLINQTLNNEVKKCLSNFEVKSKECYQLTEQIESLNATITQLIEKVQDTETRLTSSLESEKALKTKLIEIEGILITQRSTLETHEDTVAELEAKLASALAENQTLVDQIIEGQNKSEQLESVLQTTHQEMDGFQRIVLDLGRQNQALQIQLERWTNRQWVSDDSAVTCTSCNKEFTISIRKHHCRHCGKVFCNACSSKKTATTASKDPQRVCDACFTELTGSR
ncbi:unnamed protein product [Hymenolepis diminuta]|uniref:FYVE-type domain-containing protein n=1 Tax=Hymenolepis diminuta TaxID=6216 RepID=A0A158QEW1_HYMDI|nr:unnamed protein product [Hymenolepis diminuta]